MRVGSVTQASAGGSRRLEPPTTKPAVNVLMNGSIVNNTTPSYALAQGVPAASCATTDALSGVAVPASLGVVNAVTGQAVPNPPTAVGLYRARCAGALDNANLTTVTFRVMR